MIYIIARPIQKISIVYLIVSSKLTSVKVNSFLPDFIVVPDLIIEA